MRATAAQKVLGQLPALGKDNTAEATGALFKRIGAIGKERYIGRAMKAIRDTSAKTGVSIEELSPQKVDAGTRSGSDSTKYRVYKLTDSKGKTRHIVLLK